MPKAIKYAAAAMIVATIAFWGYTAIDDPYHLKAIFWLCFGNVLLVIAVIHVFGMRIDVETEQIEKLLTDILATWGQDLIT